MVQRLQVCPATFTDPPGATPLYGQVNCAGTETFVFYKDGKCRVDGSDPFFSYSTKAGVTAGTTEFEAGHCPPGNLKAACQTFSGVADLSRNTLTVRHARGDKAYVDVVYQRSFAGG